MGYGGDLNALHDRSEGPRDLETRVMGLGNLGKHGRNAAGC
jgi:hypothetical protein